jgi:hypothetical protein
MRIKKYRGSWVDVEGNRHWVYGLLTILKSNKVTGIKPGFYISNSVGMPFAYNVEPDSVGDFVGNINGQDVYEGDIQRCINPMKSKEEYAKNPYSYLIVTWNEQRYGFNVMTCDSAEVIGNVTENAEILFKDKSDNPQGGGNG